MKKNLTISILFLFIFVSVGVGFGFLLAQPAAIPPSLSEDINNESTVGLTKDFLSDSRDVQISVAVAPKQQLSAPVSGLITGLICSPGAVFSAGESNLSVSGQPVLNLATSSPLWRDLVAGDRGEDVTALTSELSRLGFSVRVSDVMQAHTVQVVNVRLAELGASVEDKNVIRRASILWLPSPAVSVLSCDAAVGSNMSDGQAVASLTAPVVGVRLSSALNGLLPGARVLEFGDESFSLDEKGQIVDPVELERFQTSARYIEITASFGKDLIGAGSPEDQSASFSGQYKLIEPLEAWALPPSALASIDGESACVISDSTPFKVDIVSSSLGKTYVIFGEGISVPQRVELHPKMSLKC